MDPHSQKPDGDDGLDLVDAPSALPSATVEKAAPPDDEEPVAETEGMAEDPPDPEDDEGGLSLDGIGSHLEELRRRLFLSLLVFAPLFILGLVLYQSLWGIVIHPLHRAAPHLARFQALGPSDGLVMAMRIAFAFALFLSLPIWLSQIWCFVAPGLTGRERRWLYLSLGSGTLLFGIGAAIAYFLGIPFALEYLLPFNQSLEGWENSFTGPGYVDFVITCCAGFGLAFELPLVMLVLGWFGILTPEAIRTWWRPIVLVIFVASAIMTPPDPFTQMLLALPMLGLFLLGYMLVKWTHREAED